MTTQMKAFGEYIPIVNWRSLPTGSPLGFDSKARGELERVRKRRGGGEARGEPGREAWGGLQKTQRIGQYVTSNRSSSSRGLALKTRPWL